MAAEDIQFGDLRGVLQYVPQFRDRTFVVAVDGGVVAEVPAVAAREEGWPVVAVDVSLNVPPIREDDLVLDTMMRTQMMTARLLRRRELRSATHIIRPGVGDARWAEWNRFDEFIDAGRKATLEFLGL